MEIKIATRKSQLALWQAEYIKAKLLALGEDISVELVPMSTKGDKILDVPLAKIGGKGLFIKELETAMMDGRANIAVHSMKDVPMEFPEGLHLSAICEREDPRDAFVSNKFVSFSSLPAGSIVGTSSLRRKAQLQAKRPDLVFEDLRGNVNSRLQKLDDEKYHAIILAAAGLKRLGFEERIQEAIDPEISLPAVGQGAVGVESRQDDPVNELLARINHSQTWDCVAAERAMNIALNGGCQVPIAGFAELNGDTLHMRGLVASADGSTILNSEKQAQRSKAENLGRDIAEELLSKGAKPILENLGL